MGRGEGPSPYTCHTCHLCDLHAAGNLPVLLHPFKATLFLHTLLTTQRAPPLQPFIEKDCRLVVLHTPPPHIEIRTQNHNKDMDLNIKGFDTNLHTVEVGADDTVEGLRRKVASAMGLPEDSFCMSFGDEAMGEGADMTQLSAGDTIILTKTQKGAINV